MYSSNSHGLLAFHAHPDDEVTSTGCSLAHYAKQGRDATVVTATDGSEGEIHNYDDPDALKPDLARIRAAEVKAALEILDVPNHEFLGYRDSGMMGTPPNTRPEAFWQADLMEATASLIQIIRRYKPDVMVIYDPFGGYGHPDHIQVHRVGVAAFFGAPDQARFPLDHGEEAWVPSKLYWTAWPRSRMVTLAELGESSGTMSAEDADQLRRAGTPDEDITCSLDLKHLWDIKERALRTHRTQIPDDWFMLAFPEDQRPGLFGVEHYQRIFSRVPVPAEEADLFDGLD